MAQHIEIRNPKAPKILQEIGANIEKQVKYLTPNTTSFKWEYIGDDTYLTSRYIGKGIVFGDTRGTFEVSVLNGKAKHIYLVA
jgi:hypothetical protein